MLELGNLRTQLNFTCDELRKMQCSSSTMVLNVYKESDSSAVMRCLDVLQPLFEHCHQLLVEFPENAQLIHLDEAISSFVNKTPAGAPLMKYAAQLERILGLHFKILSVIKKI